METDDGVLFLDMKCGNLMQQRISRIQTDQAVEIARLIKQYITIGQYLSQLEMSVSEQNFKRICNISDQRSRGLAAEPGASRSASRLEM